MKPSESPEMLLKQIAHRIIAFAFPFLFLAAMLSLMRDGLPYLPAPGVFFWLVVASGGIVPVALFGIFRAERASAAARAQALSLSVLAVYVLCVAFNPKPFPARFAPGGSQALSLVCFVAQWLWSGAIMRFFNNRELVLESVFGMDGHELYAAMRSDGFLVSETLSDLAKFSWSCSFSAAWLFIVLAVAVFCGVKPGVLTLALLALFFFLFLMSRALLRIYRDEQHYAALGLSRAFTLSGKRGLYAFAVLALCAAAALVLSSDRAVLPPDPFLYLLDLINRLIARLGDGRIPLTVMPDQARREKMMALDELANAIPKPARDLRWLVDGIRYASLAALGIGLLWFLFGSFFKKDWRDFLRERKLGNYIHAFFTRLKGLASLFLPGRKGRLSSAARSASRSAFADAILSRLHPGKSRAKKKEIGKLAGQFLLIVDWGADRGIACKPDYAPAEYAFVLSSSFPGKASGLGRAAGLFEKALYSASLLTPEEEKQFMDAVGSVLSVMPQ